MKTLTISRKEREHHQASEHPAVKQVNADQIPFRVEDNPNNPRMKIRSTNRKVCSARDQFAKEENQEYRPQHKLCENILS
jgi:hypothetical protein